MTGIVGAMTQLFDASEQFIAMEITFSLATPADLDLLAAIGLKTGVHSH